MKTAWQVGRRGDAHGYIWAYYKGKLAVSDELEWHGDLMEEAFPDNENGSFDAQSRGLIVLYPKTKTGYVMAYQGDTHSEAEFIPNDVWNAIKKKFPGYQLFEQPGITDLLMSGHARTSLDNFKNVLLQYPVAKHSGLISTEDLDNYDSEVARDLVTLHDNILHNPVRNFDTLDPMSLRRYFDFTLRSLRDKLAPSIKRSIPKLPKEAQREVRELLADADVKLNMAEDLHFKDRTMEAARFLEDGFSYLHDALDYIRSKTRNVPAVRSVRPVGVK